MIESDDASEALPIVKAKPCLALLVTDSRAAAEGVPLADTFLLSCPSGRVVLTSLNVDVESINTESNGLWVFVPKRFVLQALLPAVHRLGLVARELRQPVILLAEDEPMVRNLVQSVLSGAGYAVIAAVDGLEALELSRAYPFEIDLLISDMRMPRLDGPQLADFVRQERPQTPILLMSGYASAELRDRATSRDFIRKPFLPSALTQRINELLNQPRPGGGSVS